MGAESSFPSRPAFLLYNWARGFADVDARKYAGIEKRVRGLMFQRLRENRSAQGTLLALPTIVWMLALLIIPLLLTLVVSFGRRSADGNVIFTFSLDNYIRLLGISSQCSGGATKSFDPLYLQILWRSL